MHDLYFAYNLVIVLNASSTKYVMKTMHWIGKIVFILYYRNEIQDITCLGFQFFFFNSEFNLIIITIDACN